MTRCKYFYKTNIQLQNLRKTKMKRLHQRQRPSGRASAAARPTPRSSASWRNVLKPSSGCARRNLLCAGKSWKYRGVRLIYFFWSAVLTQRSDLLSREFAQWICRRCVYLFILSCFVASRQDCAGERALRGGAEREGAPLRAGESREAGHPGSAEGEGAEGLTRSTADIFGTQLNNRCMECHSKQSGRPFDREGGRHRTKEWRGGDAGDFKTRSETVKLSVKKELPRPGKQEKMTTWTWHCRTHSFRLPLPNLPVNCSGLCKSGGGLQLWRSSECCCWEVCVIESSSSQSFIDTDSILMLMFNQPSFVLLCLNLD